MDSLEDSLRPNRTANKVLCTGNQERRGPGGLLQDILRHGSPSKKPVCPDPDSLKIEERALRAGLLSLEGGAGPRPVSVQLLAKPLETSPEVSRRLSLVRDPSPPPALSPCLGDSSLSPVNGRFNATQYDDSSLSIPGDQSFSGFLLGSEAPKHGQVVEDRQSGKHPCTVRLVERGVMMECGKPQVSATLCFGWSQTYEIPWASIIEACVADTSAPCNRASILIHSPRRGSLNETNPAFGIVRLRTARGSSATRSAEVDVYLALEDADHISSFLSSVRCWKRWHFARRCRSALDGGMSPGEVALSDFAGLAIEADAGCSAAAVPHSLSSAVKAASVSRQRYFLRGDCDWQSLKYEEDQIPMDRKDGSLDAPPAFNSKISESSLSEFVPDARSSSSLKPPAPLELKAVWIHWTSSEQSNQFLRSVLCIDKLGLTARAHAAVEDGRMSELIHISMSSILWIGQGERPSPKLNVFSDIKSIPAVVSEPFNVGPLEEEEIPPDPPHPHVVRVEVRDLQPPKKGKAEKSRMMVMTISVLTQQEANTIMRAAMEHRRHQLLAAIRTSLPGSIANQACNIANGVAFGQALGDDGSMSHDINGQTSDRWLSPPPRPARPATLPPPHQLPQMVTSSRGEVFWHLPPQRAKSHQQTPRRGDATPPWGESPGGAR